MKSGGILIFVLCLVLGMACSKDSATLRPDSSTPYPLHLPAGAPAVPVPSDNPLTLASVQLGRALFHDDRLSRGNSLSCASCHRPHRAFSDTVAFSSGVHGDNGPRNAPSLANVAYHPLLMRDGGTPTLEQQVLVPLTDPLEMDADINTIVATLGDREPYRSLSREAYGRPFDLFVLTRALASYERTLVSGTSRFDRFMYQGDNTALTPQEQQGWAIFNGPRGHCSSCHSGHDLSDHAFHNIGTSMDYVADAGRQRITLRPSDRGKFKTPTLRNIAITGPYMHDGSLASLEQVIDHFNSGGLTDPNKDSLMVPLQLSSVEKLDLIAFLRTLTDERPLDQLE